MLIPIVIWIAVISIAIRSEPWQRVVLVKLYFLIQNVLSAGHERSESRNQERCYKAVERST